MPFYTKKKMYLIQPYHIQTSICSGINAITNNKVL